MRQLVGVADGRDTSTKGGRLGTIAGLSRQEGRHRLRACRQRRNTLGLAPRLEQPEVRPIGLAGAERLLRLRQIDRGCEVGTQGGGQVLGGRKPKTTGPTARSNPRGVQTDSNPDGG